MERELERVRKAVMPVLRRHGVTRAGIVGSVARGTETASSDVDVLVELPPDRSLVDLVQLRLDLEAAVGRPVDVAEYRAVHPVLRDRLLADQVPVL